MRRLVLLITLLLISLPTFASNDDQTDSPTTQPADAQLAYQQLATLQEIFSTSDGERLIGFVFLGGDPDAPQKLRAMAEAVSDGQLAEARVVAFDAKTDGPVTAIVTAFMKSPDDRRPDIDPVCFLKRDGKLVMLFGGSGESALTDEERAATKRLDEWHLQWLSENRETIRKKISEVK